LRVSDFVFEVFLLAQKWVWLRGDNLRVNMGAWAFIVASRQARLCAAIVRASSLFLGHPKLPPLEDDGGDTVGGVHGR
jgi:hypothetical protein